MGDVNSDLNAVKNDITVFSGKAVEKFFDTIKYFFGSKAIKRNAEAEAERMRVMGEAEMEIKQKRELSELKTDVTKQVLLEAFYQRKEERIHYEQLLDQVNIETIVGDAVSYLPEQVSDESVNPDWTRKFFDKARMISDSEVQDIWSRILAGEIAKPGSYSLRTLSILEHMTKEDAEMFRKLAPCAYQRSIYYYSNNFEKFNIYYTDILDLESIGLITFNGESNATVNCEIDLNGKKWGMFLKDNSFAYLCSLKGAAKINIPHTIILTKVGAEISTLINEAIPKEYIDNLIFKLSKDYPSIEIRKYKIINQEGTKVGLVEPFMEILWPRNYSVVNNEQENSPEIIAT